MNPELALPMQVTKPHMRRLVILGSTGSIGVNTLNVVRHLNKSNSTHIQVVGLAAGQRADVLIEQAKEFGVAAVAIADQSQRQIVRDRLNGVTVHAGTDAAQRLVEETDATDVCAAMVGSAGLPATLVAIEKGLTIALANKETLVAAGALASPMLREHGARLIPVDSEHSAIFQCLHGHCGGRNDVKRVVLTASGGPFRNTDKLSMADASVEEALNHPTWNMGPKISIDSATMMNKALEIIEAHWLFDLPGDRINVIIHPQSVVHSFVEFEDNSILAQLGAPDMKTPIQYALTYPDRTVGCSEAMDWSKLQTLAFHEPDFDKFEALELAYQVIKTGGTAGAVLNAANEAAVTAFLERQISFGRIVQLVAEALRAIKAQPADSLETILAADRQARSFVNDRMAQSVA